MHRHFAVWLFVQRALTRAWARRGQVIYEILQRSVFGWVEVVTRGILYLQPLPVAIVSLVVLIEKQTHHQQQEKQEQRACDHNDEFHQSPRPTRTITSSRSWLSRHWKGEDEKRELDFKHLGSTHFPDCNFKVQTKCPFEIHKVILRRQKLMFCIVCTFPLYPDWTYGLGKKRVSKFYNQS